MGIFDLLRGKGIGEYAAEAEQVGARLIDVRERNEFQQGHLPGAINVPLSSAESISKKIPGKDTALYVYCLSGARSSRACGQFKSMGYANVTNIGGINGYRGELSFGR